MVSPISIKELYAIFLESSGISTDSRSVEKGNLFFALKGDLFDGNKYASMAIEKGALLAIIDDENYNAHQKCIVVNDVLSTLQELAKFHRTKLKTKVIGITGTNGKTTTKELVKNVLEKKFITNATVGNLNNHIGVPLTLLRTKPETEYLILEMGANHQGEIADLCNIGKPDYGLITNIGRAHLEGFGSFEGVIKAKCELFEFIKQNNGIAFVNRDDDNLNDCNQSPQNSFTYGSNSASDYRIDKINHGPFLQLEFSNPHHSVPIESQLFGTYNALNIAAAATIGCTLGVDVQLIKEAIESFSPSNNRSQIFKSTMNLMVMDAYNANPSSMSKSIESFISAFADDRVLLLGDMLELGEYSGLHHQKIIESLELISSDLIILVGPEFCALNSKNLCFPEVSKAMGWLQENPIKNKNILIKGSRGIQLEKLYPLL